MRFTVLTLFPEMFSAVLGGSMLGRAQENGILTFDLINIRDFTQNKHNRVDDAPYGGGCGMVMQAQPIYDAYQSVVGQLDYKPHTVYLSPKGRVFDQQTAVSFSKLGHLVLLCGHYEGVDQRILDEIVDEEISIGDYVLTGGEIPAMAVIDATSRMIEGVLSSRESFTDESHFNGLLEYPHYTRPYEFHGRKVPDILLSGDHAKIAKWRQEQSLAETRKKRPDLLSE